MRRKKITSRAVRAAEASDQTLAAEARAGTVEERGAHMDRVRRWYVERPTGEFDDVGSETMTVLPCGALMFSASSDNGGELDVLYASGQWVSVVMGDD